MHSMKTTLPDLILWILFDMNDKIQACHCTCMSGLGEACSHVAALTFHLDYDYRLRIEKSVTDEFAYWRAQRKDVTPRKLKTVNFLVPSKIIANKKRNPTSYGVCSDPYTKIDCHANLITFLNNLKELIPTSVALRVVAPFCYEIDDEHSINDSITDDSNICSLESPDDDGVSPLPGDISTDSLSAVIHENSLPAVINVPSLPIPHYVHDKVLSPIVHSTNSIPFQLIFPRVLNALYKPEHELLSVEQLIEIGEGMNFHMTTFEIEEIQRLTQAQSGCDAWFAVRIGRITAYNMKNVCSARNLISMTGLKKVCYEGDDLSHVDSIVWGKTHEKVILRSITFSAPTGDPS